jgi:hypothetical protein
MSSLSYAQNIKYIIDTEGVRREVVVPFDLWRHLTEEVEALREKQRLLLGLQQACREVKQQAQGLLPEQTLEDFLDEL